MEDTQTLFDQALAYIKSGKSEGKEPSNSQKLLFYALYKQIHDGPCKGSAPSKLKVVERAKYDAWKALGQISKTDAQTQYIKLVTDLSPNWRTPKPKL